MRRMLLALGLPRPPQRGLFLRDADQHHLPVAAVAFGGFDQRAGDFLLVLALGEPAHRDRVLRGPPVHLGDVAVADLAERRRRRDRKSLLPVQELTHPAHRLQLRHIGLQKDPIHRSTGERHMIPQ
jgi:hypothetical protein